MSEARQQAASGPESVVLVFQNPVHGRAADYDEWYSGLHVRDVMRMDSAIAVQRFRAMAPDDDAPASQSKHYAHTIYEWNSAERAIAQHLEQVCTPAMEISVDADHGNGFRENFFRPVHSSFDYTRSEGLWRGEASLVVMLAVSEDVAFGFEHWLRETATAEALALPGFATVCLLKLHDRQMLSGETPYNYAIIHGLEKAATALAAWSDAPALQTGLRRFSSAMEVSRWTPSTKRLRPEDLRHASNSERALEAHVRASHRFVPRAAFIETIEREFAMDLSGLR